MPSVGIYSYELFKFYDVDNIIRIGTCGAYVDDLNLKDLILVKDAFSNSTYAKFQNGCNDSVISSSNKINTVILDTAKSLDLPIHFNTVHCSDVFYSDVANYTDLVQKYNCVGVEMESFALFHNANVLGKNASCILSVSDSFVKKDILSSEERQSSLNNMITLALESAIRIIIIISICFNVLFKYMGDFNRPFLCKQIIDNSFYKITLKNHIFLNTPATFPNIWQSGTIIGSIVWFSG